jgi:hypothetical protein
MNKTQLFSNHGLFTILLLMSIIGVSVTNISAAASYVYWISMMILFGAISILATYNQTEYADKVQQKKAIFIQLLHWLGGLVTVMIVYTFYHAGRIMPQENGLIILLVLALTTFLAGIRISWQFSFAGIFLAIIALCAAYVEEFIWQILILALAIIAFSYYWEFKRKNKE